MTEPGTTFADHQEGPAAAFLLEQLSLGRREGMRVAGQLAKGHDHPIAVSRHRLGLGRDPIDCA
jgi:hypothetical protein